MGKIYHGITELVGNTPLLELGQIEAQFELQCRLLAKLEYLNPAGSVKDRAALEMLEQAQRDGILEPGATIIEPTSGNTGIGLAAVASVKGYHCIIVIPDTMSVERRNLMKAYGAEVVLSEGKLGMKGAIAKAEELKKSIPGSFILGQFENPANANAHYKTTGPEIWRDTEQNVDIFVAGIGTGGTITGAGRYLKEQNPAIRVVGVEPASSPYLSEGRAAVHAIQGIGAGFAPVILDRNVYDELLTVEDEQAIRFGKLLAEKEGILVGISSGAAVAAAVEVAKRTEMEGKTVVVLLPDSGDRYYSTRLFEF